MATKKKTVTVEKKETLPATIIKGVPAAIIAPNVAQERKAEIIGRLDQEYELEDAPGGLSPMAEFHVEGAAIFGEYLGNRLLNIGGREQLIYDLKVDDMIVGVWGSTILNNRMSRFSPPLKMGDMLYIQYLGETGDGKKGNRAKDFRVSRMKPKAK